MKLNDCDDLCELTYRCSCGRQLWRWCKPDQIPPHHPCDFPPCEWDGVKDPGGCGGSMWLVEKKPPLNQRHWLFRGLYKASRWWQWHVTLRKVRRRNANRSADPR